MFWETILSVPCPLFLIHSAIDTTEEFFSTRKIIVFDIEISFFRFFLSKWHPAESWFVERRNVSFLFSSLSYWQKKKEEGKNNLSSNFHSRCSTDHADQRNWGKGNVHWEKIFVNKWREWSLQGKEGGNWADQSNKIDAHHPSDTRYISCIYISIYTLSIIPSFTWHLFCQEERGERTSTLKLWVRRGSGWKREHFSWFIKSQVVFRSV